MPWRRLDYGKSIGEVDVLLLADAGYAPLNPAQWIENLQPQLIILSVAAGDESRAAGCQCAGVLLRDAPCCAPTRTAGSR